MADEEVKEVEETKEADEDGIVRDEKHGFIDDDDPKIDMVEAEMLLDVKVETYGPIGEVEICHPTIKIEGEVNIYYGEVFQKLLMTTDLVTTKQLAKTLKEKEVWTEADDKNLVDTLEETFSKGITIAQLKVQEELTDDQKKHLAALEREERELETEYMTQFVFKHQLFEATVERRAEEEAMFLKVIKCTKLTETGEPIWNTVNELKEAMASPHVKALMADCVKFWKGVDHPFLERLALELAGSSGIDLAKLQESLSSEGTSQA